MPDSRPQAAFPPTPNDAGMTILPSALPRSLHRGLLLATTLCLLLPLAAQPSQADRLAQARAQVLAHTHVARLQALQAAAATRAATRRAQAQAQALKAGWPLRLTLPDGRLAELQGLSPTGQPQYYQTTNLDAAYSVGTHQLWSGGSLGLNLEGQGMTLGEWDGGAVRLTHQEFGGRVTQADGATSISNHATHVAGTLVAAGVQAQAHGMAPQASLDAYDWNSDDAEMAAAAANGLLISNHSYGTVTGWAWGDWAQPGTSEWHWFGDPAVSPTQDWGFGAYSFGAYWWDSIAVDAPYYLIVKSAGNDRNDSHTGTHQVWDGGWISSTAPREADGGPDGYDCIGYSGNAKNILTVGAVQDIPGGYTSPADVVMSSFSGWGPTDDGRIKPDLVANGIGLYSSIGSGDQSYASYSGTSMSSPNTAGSLLLLQEYYASLHGSFMRSATLKGLVIHTADEAGPAPGPDYAHGWGLLNTSRAATHLANATGGDTLLEASLAQAATYTLQVYSDGSQPLRATLVWTDYTGDPYSNQLNPTASRLVNDLDLRVLGGSTYLPYTLDPANPAAAATTGDNSRDNVEQVFVAAPAAGWYTLQVTHKGSLAGGSQAFSLLISTAGDPLPVCLGGISSFPYSEGFENGLGWSQATDDDLNWVWQTGSTPSSNTGPAGAFTGSRYAYIEASSPNYPNREGSLLSPCLDLTMAGNPRLRFAYHMWGAAMGTLRLEASTDGGQTWGSPLWTRSGNQGNAWQQDTVDLATLAGLAGVRLRFRGTTGLDYTSDIALDDIVLEAATFSCQNALPLACGDLYTGTTVGAGSNSAGYACSGWDESGPEVVHSLTLASPADITVTLSNLSADLDIFILDDCAPGACVAFGDLSATLSNAQPGTYYLVVDGYQGASGSYTLSVACACLMSVSTFPYLEGFESGPGGWASQGTGNSWALGTPAKTVIQGAAAGTQAWVTGGLGATPYPDLEQSAVVSPCFDFSNLVQPRLEMDIWWNLEDSRDGAVLQASTDGGSSWTTIGSYLDPDHWYNADNLLAQPGGSHEGWSGLPGSGGWVRARHDLDSLGGVPQVNLRLAFASDTSVAYDGFAFDNVQVYEGAVAAPSAAFSASDTSLCGSGTVTFSPAAGGPVSSYLWHFPGGSPATATTAQPVVTYNSPGTYDVQLAVVGAGGFDTVFQAGYVIVHAVPSVSLAALPAVCAGDAPWPLSGGLPAGGSFSGPGISGGAFDPAAAGAGTHAVTYTYTDAFGCSAAAVQSLTVHPQPVVSLAALDPWCQGAGLLSLSGGQPGGGQYAGPGVSGATFDPLQAGLGSHSLTYTFTTAQGCAATDTASLVVTPRPSLSWAGPAPICLDAGAVPLAAGSPAGGSYLGPGVSGAVFDPAAAGVGAHSLGYAFAENGCEDTVWALTTVWPLPAAPAFTLNGLTLTSSAVTGNQWFVDGVPIAGATGPVWVVADSGLYQVAVIDSNGCMSPLSAGQLLGPYRTSLGEEREPLGLRVYPNPAHQAVTVWVKTAPGQAVDLRLYSLAGQVVWHQQVQATGDTWEGIVPTRELASGVYLLQAAGPGHYPVYLRLEIQH